VSKYFIAAIVFIIIVVVLEVVELLLERSRRGTTGSLLCFGVKFAIKDTKRLIVVNEARII